MFTKNKYRKSLGKVSGKIARKLWLQVLFLLIELKVVKSKPKVPNEVFDWTLQ